MQRDLSQLEWTRREDIRRFAEANLVHGDDRGLLAALVLLGVDLADCWNHETLVLHTSMMAMWRNRPDFSQPGLDHEHCPVCRCNVQVRFTNREECADDTH